MIARYRTFQIQILSKIDGIQLELADVDGKAMLIATDIGYPIAPDTYTQEAYGIVDSFSEADLRQTRDELTRRLLERRAARSS